MERKPKPASTNTIDTLEIPMLTPKEQAERQRALDSILRLRAKLPPLEVSAGELVRRARMDAGR